MPEKTSYGDASDWFLVCRDLDVQSSWSRRGAEAVLTRWVRNARPMKALAEQNIY